MHKMYSSLKIRPQAPDDVSIEYKVFFQKFYKCESDGIDLNDFQILNFETNFLKNAQLQEVQEKKISIRNIALLFLCLMVLISGPIIVFSQIKRQSSKPQQLYSFRQKSSARTPEIIDINDRYEFVAPIEKIMANSQLTQNYPQLESVWQGIKKSQYERAIRLMQVVHNINFQGQFTFDHNKFYLSAYAKYFALKQVLSQQKQYYDQKYQINQYIHDQIRFCVYVPSFNNAKRRHYLRNLDSIFQQEYRNYHVVYVNDASEDETGQQVKNYMIQNEIPSELYIIIQNDERKGNCENMYNVGHNYCNPGEVMIIVDGDDALIGRQVFALLNAVYQKQKIGLTYGQFIGVIDQRIWNGISKPIPQQFLEKGTWRKQHKFYTSHLKSMYVDVFRNIPEKYLQDPDGNFLHSATDVAYMTAGIELVGTRLKFLNELNLEYRYDTGNNIMGDIQISMAPKVFNMEPLKLLELMPFADFPQTSRYN